MCFKIIRLTTICNELRQTISAKLLELVLELDTKWCATKEENRTFGCGNIFVINILVAIVLHK